MLAFFPLDLDCSALMGRGWGGGGVCEPSLSILSFSAYKLFLVVLGCLELNCHLSTVFQICGKSLRSLNSKNY